jgi:nucleoside-diphosphate-sugar epimerase
MVHGQRGCLTPLDLAWVGADGALGSMLAPALGARPVNVRCAKFAENEPLAELQNVRTVVNGAGPRVHPGLSPSDYLREHVGTALRVARSMGEGSHLVLISSAAVFGSRRGHVTEDTPPDPDSFPVPEYAWAKLAAEHATLAACAGRGVALTVLRPSIVYGPGAGGALIALRDLARRGLRVVFQPESLHEHFLHIELLRKVLENVVTGQRPSTLRTYALADPFVLRAADMNEAFRAASRFAVPLPIPVGAVGQSIGHWRSKLGRAAPMSATVAAMFALDNVYEWKNWAKELAVDIGPFDRVIFDDFIRR